MDIETSMDKLIEIDKLMLESINKKIGLLNKSTIDVIIIKHIITKSMIFHLSAK